MAQYPQLTQRFPTTGDGPVTAIRPQISLDWSADMDTTQFSNPVTLNQLINLQQVDTNATIPLAYIDYVPALKRVIVAPNQDLTRGTNFRVVVNRLIKDSFGRKSDQQYLWNFVTDTSSILQPTSLNPINFVVETTWPTFSWNSSGSGLTYELLVGTDPQLNSVLSTSFTSATSALLIGSFPWQSTFYWKVRAISSTATGAWSETNTFYYGTVTSADPTSSISYTDIQTFTVEDTTFENGLSLLTAWPSNLSLVLSSPPADDYLNYVTVTKLAQVPRNDIRESYQYYPVSGTWQVSGNVLTFNPTENITVNTRYDIKLNRRLKGQNGLALGTEMNYYFSSMYDPFYVHPRLIRLRLGAAEQHIPDDMLNMLIHTASLDAKARYYGYLTLPTNGQMIGDLLKESYVRDSKNLNSFGVLRWVEANVIYNVIKLVHMESLRKVGLSRTLEGYSESLGEAYIKSLELALRLAAEEIAKFDDYLIASDVPSVVVRSADYPVQFIRDYDLSAGLESQRADPFGW